MACFEAQTYSQRLLSVSPTLQHVDSSKLQHTIFSVVCVFAQVPIDSAVAARRTLSR